MSSIKTTMLMLALGLMACSESGGHPNAPNPPGAPNTPEAIPDFEIALSADKLPVLQGANASIEITLTRKNGFSAPVTVSAVGLPNGAATSPITFEGATAKATLTVAAAPSAPHSLPTRVTLSAKATSAEVTTPLTVTVYGPPGSLDTSFANGGKALLPVGASDDYAYALAVQPDGKILLAGHVSDNLGDFAVVRLERDGTPDASFGTGGAVMTSIGERSETALAIALQPDGKIVVAGSTESQATGIDFAMVRYLPDGKLDPMFGSGGKVTTSFTDDTDIARAVLLEPDGTILLAGEANKGTSSTGSDFALARYDASGKLDPTFGEGGKIITPISANTGRDVVYALRAQVVDGERCFVAAGGEGDFALARYTHDGKLDQRFGAQGVVSGVWHSVMGNARALEITNDGKIIAAGHSMHDFAAVRLTAAGALDETFGKGGKVATPVSTTNDDEAQGLALEADGKIVLGGWVNEGNSTSANFALVRYDTQGQLDPTFGGTGIVITEVAAKAKTDVANAMLLQNDERVPTTRVLLAGYASTSNYDFAVTRYWR